MELGQYLKHCREATSRTQPDIAKEIEIEQSYLSKLESGKSIPSNEVFNKLLKVYAVDVNELAQVLSAEALEKLSEIEALQTIAIRKKKSQLTATRTWSVLGLAMLMLGAGFFAFAILPDRIPEKYNYRSHGVLLLDEELKAYDLVYMEIKQLADDSERIAKRTELLRRLDQEDTQSEQYKGDGYVINTPEGRRFFELIGKQGTTRNYWNRWFIIPALMFFVGGFGSFSIANRWNRETAKN